jgi:hypothetical protein
MNLYPIPGTKDTTEEQNNALKSFMDEFIPLCNKHRVTFVMSSILFLQNRVIDGKLLDVAGFTYDKDAHLSLPVFVDTMSGKI